MEEEGIEQGKEVKKNYATFLRWGTVDGWNPAPVEVGGLSHYL